MVRDLMSLGAEAHMVSLKVLTGVALLGAVIATPATAAEQRGRDRSGGRQQQRAEADGPRTRGRDRAVARSRDVERQQIQRNDGYRRSDAQRRIEARRQAEVQRHIDAQRRNSRSVYVRPNRSYRGSRTVIVPRIIRPRVVTVVPYRPYVYRPRLGIGHYYGASGAYPYGYTPRGYYDPIPGRAYGGLRITDAPRDAHVFADGYYVGIVDDFDGIFQHLNLEAGPHRIEVRLPGDIDAIGFDVIIQPGRTITYRADW